VSPNGGDSEAVWNESWAPIGTGGGASVIYPRPSWQQGIDPSYGVVPDTAWNAAVNGGVDVYITAYPQFSCGNTTGCWTFFGGTSAATPQTAALVALANASRAADGKQPIGFLDPILYQDRVEASAYRDIVPEHYGSALKAFAGSEIGVSGPRVQVGRRPTGQPTVGVHRAWLSHHRGLRRHHRLGNAKRAGVCVGHYRDALGTREQSRTLMYRWRCEESMAAHASDLLRVTGIGLRSQSGRTRRATSSPGFAERWDLRRAPAVSRSPSRGSKSSESCGHCVPCRVGTVRQEEALARLLSGRTQGTVQDELALIGEIGEAMRDASICGLGQTASAAIESAIHRLGVFNGAAPG
jgi:hypothetical protein